MTRTLVAALAVMLLLAPVVPFAAVGSAAAAPAGMATIPDGNVAADVPSGESLPLSASELRGGVLASDHADSLEVVLTTADHAPSVMDSDSAAVSGDGMALVLRDDQQSAGREVALDAGQLQKALGYRPEAIRGTHEDGSTWTASAEYVDGYLVFDVPHFSSNTVTFSGEVTIDATGVTDGTEFVYSVDNNASISESSLQLTGQTTTKTTTVSDSSVGLPHSFDPQIGGNLDPTNAQIDVTANSLSNYNPGLDDRISSLDYFGSSAAMGNSNSEPYHYEAGFRPNTSGTLKEIDINVHKTTDSGDASNVQFDIYLSSGTVDGSLSKETLIKSGWDPAMTSGQKVVALDTKPSLTKNSEYHLEFEYTGDLASGDNTITIGYYGSDQEYYTKWFSSSTSTETGVPDIDYKITGALSDVTVSTPSTTETLGTVSDGETVSQSLPLAKDTSNVTIDATGSGSVDYELSLTERTVTNNPSVSISSGNGTQSISHSGSLSDSSTVTFSDQINDADISGTTTVTVSLDDPASGPAGQVDLNYSHSAQDQISTDYQASTFEESYNISHTYADATDNAQATIPFASSRVVSVGNVEYRVDGGSWSRVASANYRLDGTTLDVYLDDATGGVEAGQTVDVRATGRKIDVGNGAVTVTDPTAPGEELDTQLQIDSRSEDFHVNVGPTDDGDRVHYAYADNFPTEDYVVIDAAGNQQLYLPNAVQGDSFRVRHLDTRVVAERGDVRIDVVEAGQDPELDVSPGPGGSGDPVTVEYYNTESGVTYLLNSLTRSIVVDSDTAESPAIFEDDDSEDTWAILRDSGPSGSSSDGGGAVGQFRETASNTLGSISLPIGGSGLGQLALVGVLGLGGVVVLRRLWPFGDDSDAVTGDTGTASGSDPGLLTGVAMSLTSASQRAARTTGSGLLTALQRVLDYLGNVVSIILGNRRASIAAAVLAAIVAARVGLVQLPEGTGILIVVSGVPLATWLIMRRSDAVSRRVWLASTIAAVILGLEFVAPGTVQTAIEQLTSEQVAPLLILVGAGGLYLWYRARQSDRPQIIIGGNNE